MLQNEGKMNVEWHSLMKREKLDEKMLMITLPLSLNPEKYTPMDHGQNWKTIITASLSLVFYVNSSPPGALGLVRCRCCEL